MVEKSRDSGRTAGQAVRLDFEDAGRPGPAHHMLLKGPSYVPVRRKGGGEGESTSSEGKEGGES